MLVRLSREVALQLSRRGMTVVVVGRSAASARAAKAWLLEQNSVADVVPLECDLASQGAVHALAADFRATGLPLTVLVSHATEPASLPTPQPYRDRDREANVAGAPGPLNTSKQASDPRTIENLCE